jgi:transcriptional regulator of met regulon
MEQHAAVPIQRIHRDPFNHPHSEIVRECVSAMFYTLAQEHPGAWVKKKEEAETHRNTFALHATANENPTKSSSVMYSKVLAAGYYSQNKMKQMSSVNNATTSAVNALPFLRAFTGQHYTVEGFDTGLRTDTLYKALVALFRELEPYCVFMVNANTTHAETKSQGFLQVGIILRDEYEAVRDYDFITNIRINSPTLQEERHALLMQGIAMRELRQKQ